MRVKKTNIKKINLKPSFKDVYQNNRKLPSYPSSSQEYRKFNFQKINLHGAEDFHNVPTRRFTNAIKNLVDKEGPIHVDAVKRRVADLFQVRIGSKINQKLDGVIYEAKLLKYVYEVGDFLWPNDLRDAKLRIYKGGEERRSIEEIPPQEIILAVVECVRNSMSISEDDLIKETARLFGFRATKKVSFEIQRIIRMMLSKKIISNKSGKIVLSSTK